jgi:hypothetical protein
MPVFTDVSYNLPMFSPCVEWETNGTTFWNFTMFTYEMQPIFIDTNNTVYTSIRAISQLSLWRVGQSMPTPIFSNRMRKADSLFVNTRGDMLADDGDANSFIDMWTPNGTSINGTWITGLALVPQACRGLFVDIADTVYCTPNGLHQVIVKEVTDPPHLIKVVAGTGCFGSNADRLNSPQGIFVDTNFDLYVADLWTNRIQMFRRGERNATTMLAIGGRYNLTLNKPTHITLDAARNMYVVDSSNHRIVRAGPDGVGCIIGCGQMSGSNSSFLNVPMTLAFDSFGNLFVTDTGNNRIQKFEVVRNHCSA